MNVRILALTMYWVRKQSAVTGGATYHTDERVVTEAYEGRGKVRYDLQPMLDEGAYMSRKELGTRSAPSLLC